MLQFALRLGTTAAGGGDDDAAERTPLLLALIDGGRARW